MEIENFQFLNQYFIDSTEIKTKRKKIQNDKKIMAFRLQNISHEVVILFVVHRIVK